MNFNGINYRLIVVEDHMQHIANALTSVVDAYYSGEKVAIDFSGLRARGVATSHTGVASGPASFAKALDGMLESLGDLGNYPVVILNEDHPDHKEFIDYEPKLMQFVTRKGDELVVVSYKEPPRVGFWQMGEAERNAAIEAIERRADPHN